MNIQELKQDINQLNQFMFLAEKHPLSSSQADSIWKFCNLIEQKYNFIEKATPIFRGNISIQLELKDEKYKPLIQLLFSK